MNKKVLMILGGLIAVIAIVIGFVVFVSKSRTPAATTSTDQTATDQSAQTPDQSNPTQNTPANTSTSVVHRVSDSAAIAPALSYDSKAIWYFTPDGHLYKVNVASGLKQEYLLPDKITIDDAIWPMNGDNFILVTGTGANKSYHYYDSANKAYISYPQNLKTIDFMPDGAQIAYNWVSGLQSTFSIADKNAKNFQNIVTLPSANLTVKVSATGTRAFAFDTNNPTDGKLNLIDLNARKLVTIGTAMENTAVWSPDGKHFIYNRNPDHKTLNNDLWLGDAEAVNNTDIHIQSSVSKVVFDRTGDNFFVAVPSIDGLSETIWKVNTVSLSKQQVYTPTDKDPKINSSDLLVSNDGSELYFKNSDGYIYSIDLNNSTSSSSADTSGGL